MMMSQEYLLTTVRVCRHLNVKMVMNRQFVIWMLAWEM